MTLEEQMCNSLSRQDELMTLVTLAQALLCQVISYTTTNSMEANIDNSFKI